MKSHIAKVFAAAFICNLSLPVMANNEPESNSNSSQIVFKKTHYLCTIDRPDTPVVGDDDSFDSTISPHYCNRSNYDQLWNYTALSQEKNVHPTFNLNGVVGISIVPFRASSDFVLDHVKYIATSKKSFNIPTFGSIQVSADIKAKTPGATAKRMEVDPLLNPGTSLPTKYPLIEGQQAAATLHLIDFQTGALFDFFVSGNKAFALYERLEEPTAGLNKMYTQIVAEVDILPILMNHYAITYTRMPGSQPDQVVWTINGREVARVNNIGVPLDQREGKENMPNIVYPSVGPGESLKNTLTEFSVAHGIFSLLDQFPFNQFSDPKYTLSIPAGDPDLDRPINGIVHTRLFGQGVEAEFRNLQVITVGVNE